MRGTLAEDSQPLAGTCCFLLNQPKDEDTRLHLNVGTYMHKATRPYFPEYNYSYRSFGEICKFLRGNREV